MLARLLVISGDEIRKLTEKTVNTNTFKTIKTWVNVWKWWPESKGLNDDIVEYEAEELDECIWRFFAEKLENTFINLFQVVLLSMA